MDQGGFKVFIAFGMIVSLALNAKQFQQQKFAEFKYTLLHIIPLKCTLL